LRCLIVEDDTVFAQMLEQVVESEGGYAESCGGVAETRRACGEGEFDLILLDNRLPDGTGFELYPWLARTKPHAAIVMITGVPELAQAVTLTRNGLFDYLTKPLKLNEFLDCLRRARRRLTLAPSSEDTETIRGESAGTREVVSCLTQAARHAAATVLLTGETGTGKDLAARVLHRWTHPKDDPGFAFVPLNCPAVPSEMFEAELFGSEKGSYTGSDRRRTGLVEAAGRGTLFLDEIVEIPLHIQAKLLRFLESREYRALGTTTVKTFEGRVVAATNRCLEQEVARGRFREDLMYRLDMFRINVPPLRERFQDLEVLSQNLLGQLCIKYGRTRPHLRDTELAVLCDYPFPGNIRELRNLLERSLLKTPETDRWLALDLGWLNGRSVQMSPPATAPLSDSPVQTIPDRSELNALEQSEYRLIAQTLEAERGGIRRAASRLGITHQALLRRLNKWPELRQSNGKGDPAPT